MSQHDSEPIDGHQPIDGSQPLDDPDVPWAMQVALRYDKADLPDEDLVAATAARAVVTLLADHRARDGDWSEAVRRWRDGRIRKLVRRARGVRWEHAQAVPGVTVTDGPAAPSCRCRPAPCLRSWMPSRSAGRPIRPRRQSSARGGRGPW